MVGGAPRAPTRRRAATSMGRTVAESPMRCGRGRPDETTRSSSRSTESARWAPRLSGATAWISSRITVRTRASERRPDSEVSRMKSDSGVVTSTCGGRLLAFCRSAAGVSPVRTAARRSSAAGPKPSSTASAPISAMGCSRFLWMSLERALSGET